MIASNINAALDLIIRWEGADVNRSPEEPGGISKYGISLTTYADYCKKSGQPVPTFDTISNLTETNARQFYSDVFLTAVRFNDLPSGVDIQMANIAVNLGIQGAIHHLQLVLLQWPLVDSITDAHITLINEYGPKMILFGLSAAWIANKYTKPSWSHNGHGWSNRNINITSVLLGANT